uniref:Uncharacterized protein n=1 Tax=Siphoviridae sp. ctcj91 TaxID=2826395 RepID=A0A8S5QXB8_9CAUD|nr:MAG TPA: hypothetical protein [Siphoviridae sp. ctcj91]
MENEKTEPLTTALSFYPRLKHSIKVSEKHAMLICEKIPGEKFGKNVLERQDKIWSSFFV